MDRFGERAALSCSHKLNTKNKTQRENRGVDVCDCFIHKTKQETKL